MLKILKCVNIKKLITRKPLYCIIFPCLLYALQHNTEKPIYMDYFLKLPMIHIQMLLKT